MGIDRTALLLASVVGFSGVALGAFGAHGMKARLSKLSDGEQRLSWWTTGAHYHLAHAVAIGLAAVRPDRPQPTGTYAAWLFLLGVVLFSGSLYTMALTGIRKLGAVTPLGGLAFLAGWALLGIRAWSMGE